jgi:hypothetical protein
MRHGLDFVDLQNPKVRRPPVRLEQRIMIGTETPWCALTMDGALNMQQTLTPVMAPQCTPTPTRRRVNWSMTTSTQ